ncbi:hypothetical protein [Xenorhabdus bovienii]|uniref:hypothetical protein n=1 Tax=Xenorhabdus bovienii TaxID=40576 RepID=UPI0023B2147E|nr:hypothetical protein [Xenorhabdus bovienii]MDE9456007.1 hypothetical protein [Xenorhabdus bovienii]
MMLLQKGQAITVMGRSSYWQGYQLTVTSITQYGSDEIRRNPLLARNVKRTNLLTDFAELNFKLCHESNE